jgi:hypothetical protein
MNFNEFNWHDAIIRNIQIDRSSPGIKDTIVLEMEWPEEKGKTNFIFEEVYWASLHMNFGIVASETLLNAFELEECDSDLKSLYSKWKGLHFDVKLKIYKFNLNSTGSEIKIIAKRFREEKSS